MTIGLSGFTVDICAAPVWEGGMITLPEASEVRGADKIVAALLLFVFHTKAKQTQPVTQASNFIVCISKRNGDRSQYQHAAIS